MKTKMCKLINVALALLMMAGLSSCKKEHYYFYNDNEAGTFDIQGTDDKSILNNSITLTDGDSLKIIFTPSTKYQNKNLTFTISCPKLEEVEGIPGLFIAHKNKLSIGENTISVSVQCNQTEKSSDDEYVYSLSAKKDFKLILKENISLEIDLDDINLAATGGEQKTVLVTSNQRWEASSNVSWLKVNVSSVNEGILIYAEDNTSTSERSGIVTIATLTDEPIKKEIKVTQAGKESSSVLFEEPYIAWGTARTNVKNAMSARGYTLVNESTSSSDGYYLAYNGKYKEYISMYMFDSDMNLESVSLMVQTSVASLYEVKAYLTSELNYLYITSINGVDGYVSSDKKTIVAVTAQSVSGTDFIRLSFTSAEQSPDSDTLFEAPYTEWGASRSNVKSTMSNRGYTLANESNSASDNYYLAYNGKKKEMTSMYLFDTNVELKTIAIILQQSDASVSEVGTFLTEKLGYIFLAEMEGSDCYFSSDYTNVVLVNSQTLDEIAVTMVQFADISSLYSSSQKPSQSQLKTTLHKLQQSKLPLHGMKVAAKQAISNKFLRLSLKTIPALPLKK